MSQTAILKKDELSDEELVKLAKDKKNYLAFEKLLSRYERPIYNLSFKFMRNKEKAEEVTQDTFLSVFRNLDNFRLESSFKTWIYRVATNFALMKIRKNKRSKEFLSEDSTLDTNITNRNSDPENAYEKMELTELIKDAIAKLPQIYRTAFLLRDVEGFSNQEVADILNISLPALKSRILRARLLMRDYLGEHI